MLHILWAAHQKYTKQAGAELYQAKIRPILSATTNLMLRRVTLSLSTSGILLPVTWCTLLRELVQAYRTHWNDVLLNIVNSILQYQLTKTGYTVYTDS